jgi:hypothetical protein
MTTDSAVPLRRQKAAIRRAAAAWGTRATALPDSAVKHRPADVVPQSLIVKYKLANHLRELVTLPLALKSPRGFAPPFRRGGTYRLDRVSGCTKLVRGDMCDGRGLPSRVRGVSCCPTQLSRRAHRMAARAARLHHLDLATHPRTGILDRPTWSRVLRSSQLEKAKDVLRARCRPKSEEMVIRIGKGPTAADRYEARVPDTREDHGRALLLPTPKGAPEVDNLG